MKMGKDIGSLISETWRNHVPPELDPRLLLDRALAGLSPWEIVLTSFVVFYCWGFLARAYGELKATDWKRTFFKLVKKLPTVKHLVEKELSKSLKSMEDDLSAQLGDMSYLRELPDKGWSKERIVREIERCMALGEFKAEAGALSGVCHKPPDPEKVEAVTEAYRLTAYANPLNPEAFPGIRKMEAEVVRMAVDIFHGDEDACGTMTSGGTESLILACKAYRNFARESRGINRPNLVMSASGHVGFDKAGHLLGIEVRKVPMVDGTMEPDMKKFRRAIDSNTIMLVASTPQYPHGVMDPVSAIAAVARRWKLPLHVDACLGGFLLAFMGDAGFAMPPADFRVAEITSISADTHKFGYAPKGSSLILYRSREHIHHQFYVNSDWSGGVFISPTMAGSRSGGIIAATWAAMVKHGRDGYVDTTRKVVSTLRYIADGIRNLDGLRVMGNPQCCIVAFTSDKFHIFTLAEEMRERGWLLSNLQHPTCVHLYVTPMHTQAGIKERFLNDLTETTAKLVKEGNKALTGRAAAYGMATSLPDRGIVDEMVLRFMDTLYSTRPKSAG